jgi:diguanylate cyclase (GGDEF)-like protein
MGVGQAIPAITLAVAWSLGGSPYDLVIAFSGLTVSVLVSARVTSLLARIHDQSGQLASLARSDELTGLHNRRSWGYELARACNDASERGYDLCVALVDLDNFKMYNDSYGHPAGDVLLRECADKWRRAIGEDDVLARYGGEEFAVVLPGCDLDRAVEVMNELREATPGGQTVSVGVAAWAHGTDPADAMSKADAALYRAKRAGRNRVIAADGTELAPLPGPLKYVRTVVQPIVRAKDLEVVGYEALTRFAHDDDVEAVFAEAHESGFGDLLEVTAIERALAAPGRPEGIDLFVNVSERAMRSGRFWDELPFDLHGVVVELHEHRDGLDDDTIVGYLDRFRARGARIGLDDLGVRGTDLARIANLCPDIVKLDRSRVEACDQKPAQLALLKELIDFSLEFGVAVCVEGVETEAELAAVCEAGATLVQGFLLGRPQVEWYAEDATLLEDGDEAEVMEQVVEHVY